MTKRTYEEEKRLWKAYNEGQKSSYEKWLETKEGKAYLAKKKEKELDK